MKKLISKVLNATKNYNVWDFGWLKVTLCALGIILGAYFSQFFLRHMTIVWIVFIVGYVWIMYKTFIKYKN